MLKQCPAGARSFKHFPNAATLISLHFLLFLAPPSTTRVSNYTQGRRTKDEVELEMEGRQDEGLWTQDPGPVGWHRMCGRSHR